MPYVERIYKGEPTGERYYTPESGRERQRRENTEKAAARLRQLLQKNYEGKVTVTISYEPSK